MNLKTEIESILSTYHIPTVRYSHLGFSSKNFLLLDEIFTLLKSLLPDYTVWDGNHPDTTLTPALPCYYNQFIDKVFEPIYKGLIIQYPHYWFQHWHPIEKQAFWSALSERHGGHHVLIIFTEGNDFSHLNRNNFNPLPLESTAVTAWVSTKTLLK